MMVVCGALLSMVLVWTGPRGDSAELSWVGLFNPALIEWLENQNRLEALCKESEGSTLWYQCRSEKMEPKVLVIPVRHAPSRRARILGTVVVVATPGQVLRAYASVGGVARPFVPDLFDGDWGYGPYFHQTVRGRSGSWFQVPIDGISAESWIDTSEWTETPDIRPVGGIISTPQGDMVVLGFGNRQLRVRPEQPADLWCESGEPPALQPWKEIRIPFEALFDANGHLRVHVKYTRGC